MGLACAQANAGLAGSARLGTAERKAKGRANLLHTLRAQSADAASQSRLSHGNGIVQIDGAAVLHPVIDVQNHFGGHTANGRRDRRDGDGRQMADRAVASNQ